MSCEPILVIKDTDSTIGIRARVGEEFFEHEIQLNVMLAYYWDNDLPVIESLIDLFENAIKRTVNEVIPHENLYLRYNLITDGEIENATKFEIYLLEVKADDVVLRLDGKILALKDLGSKEDYSKGFLNKTTKKDDDLIFNESKKTQLVEKNIQTKTKISFKDFARQQRLKEN